MVAILECICHAPSHRFNKVSAGATQHNIHRVHFSMYLLAQRNITKCTMVFMMHDSNIRMYVSAASATQRTVSESVGVCIMKDVEISVIT